MLESLDVHASGAEIAAAARRGASMLQDEADAHAIAEIIGHDAPDGLGALGPDATRHSLEQLRVRTLYLTPRYEDEHAAAAEDAVRGALDQGASVEHLSPAAAARHDTYGGIAARFRYHAVDAVVTATPEATTMPAAAVAALNDSFATHSG